MLRGRFESLHADLDSAHENKAAIAEQKQMGALLVGVEKVSYLVSRCDMDDALYCTNSQDEVAQTDLERSPVGLYTIILQYPATSITLLVKRSPARVYPCYYKPG